MCYSSVHQKRSDPDLSCVSMKSDWSMAQPVTFNTRPYVRYIQIMYKTYNYKYSCKQQIHGTKGTKNWWWVFKNNSKRSPITFFLYPQTVPIHQRVKYGENILSQAKLTFMSCSYLFVKLMFWHTTLYVSSLACLIFCT